jgi:hypothetical protein
MSLKRLLMVTTANIAMLPAYFAQHHYPTAVPYVPTMCVVLTNHTLEVVGTLTVLDEHDGDHGVHRHAAGHQRIDVDVHQEQRQQAQLHGTQVARKMIE